MEIHMPSSPSIVCTTFPLRILILHKLLIQPIRLLLTQRPITPIILRLRRVVIAATSIDMGNAAVQGSEGTDIGLASGANCAVAVGLILVFLGLEVGGWDGHGGCGL